MDDNVWIRRRDEPRTVAWSREQSQQTKARFGTSTRYMQARNTLKSRLSDDSSRRGFLIGDRRYRLVTDAAQTLFPRWHLAPVIGGIGVEIVGFSARAATCAGPLVVSALPCVLSRSGRSMLNASAWT